MFLPLFFAACFYRILVNEIDILHVSRHICPIVKARVFVEEWTRSAKKTTSGGRIGHRRWVGQVVDLGSIYYRYPDSVLYDIGRLLLCSCNNRPGRGPVVFRLAPRRKKTEQPGVHSKQG